MVPYCDARRFYYYGIGTAGNWKGWAPFSDYFRHEFLTFMRHQMSTRSMLIYIYIYTSIYKQYVRNSREEQQGREKERDIEREAERDKNQGDLYHAGQT